MESAMVATVKENLEAFTSREIERARKARELLARMGFPTVPQAISIMNSGNNFEVSARDFDIADAIWGKDIASLKGKTGKKVTMAADMTVRTKIAQQAQVLSIDIMFIDKIATLIGVATPLGLTIAAGLINYDSNKASRSAAVLKKAILYFIEVLMSQNFKTSVIMCDGEGAMTNILPTINSLGIDVDISGAGGHVARVERRIRVVKERVRAHVAYHLPFTLSTVGISMCILYVVSRLNYEPAGVREWGPSPREAFTGRKPDGKKDFRCSFGDYAQCTLPNTDSSMKSRTDDCVVMLPLGNRTGTVRMLSLATGKLVNRDQFRILPMPLSVIQRLNELARKDGRIKGKGELASAPTYYETDTGVRDGLPETIEVMTDDGVDPSIKISDRIYTPELADETDMETEPMNSSNVGEPHSQSEVNYADNIVSSSPHQVSNIITDTITDPNAGMDDLMDGFGGMHVDRFDPMNKVSGSTVPYGTNAYSTAVSGANRTEGIDYFPQQSVGDKGGRGNIMNFFRKGALLTRVYHPRDSDEWEHKVLNISVSTALRTRGSDAVSVIEKELKQMITKKVWTPVNISSLSSEERRRIIRSSMFLKEKFLASGEYKDETCGGWGPTRQESLR